MSTPGTGAQRLPQLSNFTPKAINSTPTTAKQSNTPGINKMVPQEHLTCNHEDTPKDHVSHPKIYLIHKTTTHGTHLDHHPVPHIYYIHTRDLDYILPGTINGRGTDGRIQTHKGGIGIPMPQALT